jgi:hypothetical protein
MTRLERRCRRLLRAYPAAYRRERGEEIIATLLEATPEGCAWPRPRDVRALAMGGLRARAAVNRQRTTAANVRVAVLVGVAAYLCLTVPGALATVIRYERGLGITQMFWAHVWPGYVLPVVVLAAGVITWVSRRRPVVLAAVLAAAGVVFYAGPWRGYEIGPTVADLACLAALIVVASGRDRPSLRWLWPLGIIVACALLLEVDDTVPWRALWVVLILALFAASLALLIVDARPAIAMAVCALVAWLPVTVENLQFSSNAGVGIPVLIIGLLGAGAFWRLRRQSAH